MGTLWRSKRWSRSHPACRDCKTGNYHHGRFHARFEWPGGHAHYSQHPAGNQDSTAYLAFVEELVRSAFRAGARGYVLKSDAEHELVRALNVLAGDGTYVSPGIDQHTAKQAIVEET